jgi:Kef-type K+ transport system membrane component KefB
MKMEIIWYGIYVAFDEHLCFMIFRTMAGNDSSFIYFILYVAYSKVLLLIYRVLLFNKNLFGTFLRLYAQEDSQQNIALTFLFVVILQIHLQHGANIN